PDDRIEDVKRVTASLSPHDSFHIGRLQLPVYAQPRTVNIDEDLRIEEGMSVSHPFANTQHNGNPCALCSALNRLDLRSVSFHGSFTVGGEPCHLGERRKAFDEVRVARQ